MKRKLIFGFLFLAIIVCIISGISFYIELENEKDKNKIIFVPAMQCRGHVTSREVVIQNKFKLPKVKDFKDVELQEFAYYQLLYAFTNFQYNPLEGILQYATLRKRPDITVEKVTDVEYGKNIQGEVSLSPFFKFDQYPWPNQINENSKAIIVSYRSVATIDFCLKNDQVFPESLSFYTPVDPVYAYYYLEKKHWKHRELEPWGKTIQINLCQNLHQYFDSDKEYATNYWYLWNPTKRGKELHTGFYECLDFLKENEDFYKLKTTMKIVKAPSYMRRKSEKIDQKNKNTNNSFKIRIVASMEKLQGFDYYQTTIPQIFSGRNFLSSIPNLSRQDNYIFRLLERLNEFILKGKLIKFEEMDKNYLFLFTGVDTQNKNINFSIELGENFETNSSCRFGVTYSDEVQMGAIYQISNCEKEAFFIPLAAQMSQFESIKSTESDRYYLLGQPGLAEATEGAYLVDFFGRFYGHSLLEYLEDHKIEEGFKLLRHSSKSK